MQYALPTAVLIALLATACANTELTRLDSAPPGLDPVPGEEVAVYSGEESLDCDFDRVALIKASSITAHRSVSAFVDNAKPDAGEMGANAIIIQDFNERSDVGGRNGELLAVYERRPCE